MRNEIDALPNEHFDESAIESLTQILRTKLRSERPNQLTTVSEDKKLKKSYLVQDQVQNLLSIQVFMND